MPARIAVLGLILCAGLLLAADGDPLLVPDREPPRRDPAPGEAPPRRHLPVQREPPAIVDLGRLLGHERQVLAPGAWWIRWDDYRTVIVVDAGGGQLRPAWVATYDVASGALVVAYRAQARIDPDGTLRVDGRQAVITGPQAWQWSPDSFLIGTDRQVTTFDDNPAHPGQHGEVERMIDGRKDAEQYRTLLRTVIALVGGTS
jgi:hypothetical protein